jgi:hypothetical protein
MSTLLRFWNELRQWSLVPAASLSGVLPVANGGTGDSSLTANAVLLGEGTAPVAFAVPGTAGRFLRDNGAGVDPSFAVPGPPYERTLLLAATTFYIATNGNDASDGLTTGTPWLTLAHAMAVITGQYDFGGQAVLLQAVAGHAAFTGTGLHIKPWTGGGGFTFDGGGGSIAATSDNAIDAANGPLPGVPLIQNVALSTTGSTGGSAFVGHGVLAFGAQINIGAGVSFGACIANHMLGTAGGIITLKNNYSITGGAIDHAQAATASEVLAVNLTVTLIGTPAFTGNFAHANFAGSIIFVTITFSGAATGTRYLANLNGTIFTASGGANYFPGNAAGSTSSGGQYL